jgi:hypothetical protein
MRQKNLSRLHRTSLLAALLLAAPLPALAGSIPLAWNPVPDADVAGYRVYHGTAPGSYTQSVDVGNVTSTTLSGLADCTVHYVSVKAYDTSGNLSASYAGSISGMPTPAITTVSPSSGVQGQALTLTVSGSNFGQGASAVFPDPKVSVSSTSVPSCNQIQAAVSIAADTTAGWKALDVINTDQSAGSKSSALQVAVNLAPSVSSTNPADGASSVSVSIQPTVTFSEAMLASSITSATVRLLRADGSAVTQGAGSPSLNAAGTVATITPSANLGHDSVYRIEVLGGATGARDLTALPLASGYAQATGFRTALAPDTIPPTVQSTNPASGATGVELSVHPRVTLSEPAAASSVASSTVRLLRADGSAVSQAAGSPSLDGAGTTITITPASPLAPESTYRISVLSGGSGVKDVAGNPLAATFTMSPGFTTIAVDTPPAVTGTNPADGATGVARNVRPSVTFSEQVDPASIGSASVRLLGPGAIAVSQAAGSPSLDATGRIATIVPAQDLAYDTLYQIQVVGLSGGVKDLQGAGMTSTFQHSIGFRTVAPPPPPVVVGSSPADGSQGVPMSVRPTVTFDIEVDPASVTPATIILRGPDGLLVPQAPGSPSLDGTGRVVTITPLAPLAEFSWYRLSVSEVKSLVGTVMSQPFGHSPGFQTVNLPPGNVPNLRRNDTR